MSAAAERKARSARRRAIESDRHVGVDMAGWRKEAATSDIASSPRPQGRPKGAAAPLGGGEHSSLRGGLQ
jgi:hypothetical protein